MNSPLTKTRHAMFRGISVQNHAGLRENTVLPAAASGSLCHEAAKVFITICPVQRWSSRPAHLAKLLEKVHFWFNSEQRVFEGVRQCHIQGTKPPAIFPKEVCGKNGRCAKARVASRHASRCHFHGVLVRHMVAKEIICKFNCEAY
jgi:hypothetical protein